MRFHELTYMTKRNIATQLFRNDINGGNIPNLEIVLSEMDREEACDYYYRNFATMSEKQKYELVKYREKTPLYAFLIKNQHLPFFDLCNILYEKKVTLRDFAKIDYRLFWYGKKSNEYLWFHKLYLFYEGYLKELGLKINKKFIQEGKKEAKDERAELLRPILEYFVSDENVIPDFKLFCNYYGLVNAIWKNHILFYQSYDKEWKQRYLEMIQNKEKTKQTIERNFRPVFDKLEKNLKEKQDLLDYYQFISIPFHVLRSICVDYFTKKEFDILSKYCLTQAETKATERFEESLYDIKIQMNQHEYTQEEKDEVLSYLEREGYPITNQTYIDCLKRVSGQVEKIKVRK